MNRQLIKIFPGFIKKADKYLLLHFPLLWSSRLLRLGFLCTMVVLLLFLLIDISPMSYSGLLLSHNSVMWLSILCGIILFIYWIYVQAIFNFGIHHGKTRKGHYLIVCFLFFVTFFFIYGVIVLPSLYYNYKLKKTFFDDNLKFNTAFYYEKIGIQEEFLLDQGINKIIPDIGLKTKIALKGLSDQTFDSIGILNYGGGNVQLDFYTYNATTYKMIKGTSCILDISKQTSMPIESEKFNNKIIVHRTPVLAYTNGKHKSYEFSSVVYEIDNAFFNPQKVHFRLISEAMLTKLVDDGVINTFNFDPNYWNIYDPKYENPIISDKVNDLKELDRDIRNAMYTTNSEAETIWLSIFFIGTILLYYLFFSTLIIKYFDLRTYMIGLIIAICIYSIFVFFRSFFLIDSITAFNYKGIIVFLIIAFIMVVFSYRAKKKLKILLLQQIIYFLPFLGIYFYILTNYDSYSYIVFHEKVINVLRIFGIKDHRANNFLLEFIYPLVGIITFSFIIIPLLSHRLYKVYSEPSLRS